MLIKRLEIRNCRKIKQADIDFHGPGLQVVQGPNQSGKSTIAQCIALTMEGPKSFSPGMINRDEEQAEVICYTDSGLQIKTTVKDNVKQTVSEFNETAKRYVAVSGGVRSFLDSIRSGLELPWAMKDYTDAKIIEVLKERTGISQRIAEIDAAIKDKETARRDVGRDKTKMGTATPVKEAKHPEPIDEIKKERERTRKYQNDYAKFQTHAKETIQKELMLAYTFEELESLVSLIKTEVEDGKEKLLHDYKDYTQKSVSGMKQLIESLDKKIADWYEIEEKAKAYDEYLKKAAEIEELATRYEALTKEIEELRNERKRVLSDMRLGVRGLEIGEDNLLYHDGNLRGITETNKIGNWSTAESVQVFFQIAVRFSGEMKVLIVDNAESLDDKTTQAISVWAEKSNYLVILLKVASIPDDLEDGIIYVKEGEVLAK
jgi:DNA repair exonuclease SbcCD ATPase subunit